MWFYYVSMISRQLLTTVTRVWNGNCTYDKDALFHPEKNVFTAAVYVKTKSIKKFDAI